MTARWYVDVHMPEGTTTYEVQARSYRDALVQVDHAAHIRVRTVVEAHSVADAQIHRWTVDAATTAEAVRLAMLHVSDNA